MTAADLLNGIEGGVSHYYCELDVQEDFTFKVPRMSQVLGVICTPAENIDSFISITISGNTITFHESAGSGCKVHCKITGRL